MELFFYAAGLHIEYENNVEVRYFLTEAAAQRYAQSLRENEISKRFVERLVMEEE